MDLFIRPVDFEWAEPGLTKTAAETALPEDPNSWPQEVLQELYKQVPYISEFEPHVNMAKVDAERGYGLGAVEVMNQTETQQGTPSDQLAAAGIRQVRIPIVIKDGKLQPFDLLIKDDSTVMPLTEARLRTALFRPQAFDVTSQTPGDQSMIGQLYPPYRQNYGFGGGGMALNIGMGKQGSALEEYLQKEADFEDEHGEGSPGAWKSPEAMKEIEEKMKKGSVLRAILPTLNASDLHVFRDTLQDQSLQAQYVKNASATQASLELLLNAEPVSLQKTSAALPSLISPSVVQVVKTGGSYKVKTASHRFWQPYEELVDRGQVVKRFGVKLALAADTSGAATVADEEGVEEPAPDEDTMDAAPIQENGLYKVQDADGREMIGHVFVDLLDVDGTPLPLSLFTNGAASSIQGDIVGVPAGEATELPTADAPTGFGTFVSPEGQATVPLEIGGSFTGPGEDQLQTFQATTFDGRDVQVCVQPNLQMVAGMDDKMLVPDHWRWVPLEESNLVGLKSATEDVDKEASARRAYATVQVRAGGHDSFSFDGPALAKLASDQKQFLNLDDAMFLLAGLGVKQTYGVTKLGEALNAQAPVSIRVGRWIEPVSESVKTAAVRAQEKLAKMPALRRQLFKEASAIPDPMAVDTVLSLGFLNPENLMTFVSYLPTIEESQKRMSELLMAARLGMQDIPTPALERAIRSTEEVLEGLKIIAFHGS